MISAIALLLVGLAILIVGAEGLVRGASSLAKRMGIPPLVIGLTIVAFGTSAPELIVNIFSALNGTTDLAIGNVIGSNIANILLILGVAACITPLAVQRSTTWKEIPFALLAIVLVFVMGFDTLVDKSPDNFLTRSDGLALIGFFAIFMYYVFGISRQGGALNSQQDGEEIKLYNTGVSLGLTAAGILGLFLGGNLLVENAIVLAKSAGVSESLIGLTIVAVGTSLPELATSVVAAMRKQSDIAIGNVVGSNIFNVFWILGLTSTIFPLHVSEGALFDIGVAVLATLVLFFFMFVGTRNRLDRWQGALFLASYAAYIVYLVMRG